MNTSADCPDELALYVVATPIGNLQDLSNRATQILLRADLIAAEDTRHSRTLLSRIGSKAQLISAHAHNERSSATTVIRALENGRRCALISDAGTPAISDPGARLVQQVRAAGFRVVPIAGPSAAVALLSAAGIDADRFGSAADRYLFAGFLPTRSKARLEALRRLRPVAATIVLFESPKRIESLMQAIETVFGGERLVVLGRELSKKFEQIVSLPAAQMRTWLGDDSNRRRGEFVLAIAPAPQPDNTTSDAIPIDADSEIELRLTAGELMNLLGRYLAPAKAARLASRLSRLPTEALYKIAIESDSQDGA